MTTFNGYRASKLAGGGLQNGYHTPRAKQEWSIGAMVNVGFVKNLMVLSKDGAVWTLKQIATGRDYTFEPHLGLTRA